MIKSYVVIPASPDICRLWGTIRHQRRQQPISSEDAWIAATAVAEHCPLLTHNSADFGNIPNLLLRTAIS